MTTNPWDESAHPRGFGGRFTTTAAEEAALGSDGIDLSGASGPVYVTPTYRDKGFACFQATDAVNKAFGAPTDYDIDGAQAVYADLATTLADYESGAVKRSVTAARLREIADEGVETLRAHKWSRCPEYATEHLNRVADLIEGKQPAESAVSCRECVGYGEVATGQTEHETGAVLTRDCSCCSGTGVVDDEAFTGQMWDLSEALDTAQDRWFADDPESSPSAVARHEEWKAANPQWFGPDASLDPWASQQAAAPAPAPEKVDWKTAYRRDEVAKAAARWPGEVDRPLNDDPPF